MSLDYECIQRDHNKWELVGKKHCGNGNDALYCSGTLEECTQFFEKYKKQYDGTLILVKMRKDMTENVIDVLAEELHRMTNERYAPTQESIRVTLLGHLWPYLNKSDDLCPRTWANFYNGWKDIESDNNYDVLPIWMISEHMMRRHPKFFKNSTMMAGPMSLFARKDGAKIAVGAITDIIATYDMQQQQQSGILEDIQDTRACGRIVGSTFTRLINEVCDQLAQKWNAQITEGGMICPYLPLLMYSEQKEYWKNKIYFMSRYGVVLKEKYNP